MKSISTDVKAIILTCLLLFFVALGFRMWGLSSQFEVWDETAVVRNGELYLNYIKARDFSKESWKLNKEHPPLSKYLYGASRIVSLNVPYFSETLDQEYPIGRRYTFQRFVSVVIGSLGVVLVYLLARRFYDQKTGVLAALIFSFIPYVLAHSRVATQENLVGVLTLFATALFFWGLFENKLYNKKFIFAGIALGLAMLTKFNAIFYLILFGISAFIWFKDKFKEDKANLYRNSIIWVPVIVVVMFILLWPWMWSNPIEQFLLSSSRITESRYLEYFLGQFPSPHPWYYFIVYFFATTPPILLIGLFLFIFKMILNRGKYDILFLLYFLTPFLSVFSPLKMDGIRYIYPVYSALAIVSAVGFGWFISWCKKNIDFYVLQSHAIVSTFVVGILVMTAVMYHPYYWDYYNAIVGGPKNVYEKRLFDFGYWGEGLRGAMNYLNDKAEEEDITLLFKLAPMHVLPPPSDKITQVSAMEHVQYVMINPTGEWLDQDSIYLNYDFPEKFDIVYEDDVMGVSLVKVYKRNEPYSGRLP